MSSSSLSTLPHGYCLLWDSSLLWTPVISDTLIATAYYSIPAALVYFVIKRRDLPFTWVFFFFGAFILACGTTHIMGIWTIWQPKYWLDGAIKVVTAGISVASAVALWPLIPKAVALPSPAQLALVNQELTSLNLKLQSEIARRAEIQQELEAERAQLAARIADRTAEITEQNEKLKQSERDLQAANERLKEQVMELEAFHDVVVGRELKMMDLEKEVSRLQAELMRVTHGTALRDHSNGAS